MMALVIGGSGSGKSSYAEELAVSLSSPVAKKYYLATMQVFGREGEQRVERHRALRRGKGFLTIEQPTEIQKAVGCMEEGERVALLECISNLTANEMFQQPEAKPGAQAAEQVIQGVGLLGKETAHLVVVSNNVFEDGICYDPATMEYIRAMGRINRALAQAADYVVEVVAGIPVVLKQGLNWKGQA
jgi:adenosylcobinamide kinase/adenosylcobinamide-phosphate guanylyltransferase